MSFSDSLPPKRLIFDYWKDRLGELRLLIDWGEPSCWACGFHYGSKYDVKRSDASWEEILRCWDRIPLQRCHVIPKSLGGSDKVENLFLMCRECHDTAPNTAIPVIFFDWAKAQSWERRETYKINQALEAYNLTEFEHDEVVTVLKSSSFDAWCSGKVGIHRPQSNYAPVSSRLTPTTLIGLAAYYIRTGKPY
jgi:hypothetical protein